MGFCGGLATEAKSGWAMRENLKNRNFTINLLTKSLILPIPSAGEPSLNPYFSGSH